MTHDEDKQTQKHNTTQKTKKMNSMNESHVGRNRGIVHGN
jgi:hypothetical protein